MTTGVMGSDEMAARLDSRTSSIARLAWQRYPAAQPARQ